MAEHVLFCLKCRGIGHNVKHCPSAAWDPELSWMFLQARRSIDLWSGSASLDQNICRRCESLKLGQLLEQRPPWTSQFELTEAFEEGNQSIRSQGNSGTIEFWADCPVCCCLFAMMPKPGLIDQEVILLPDWTICCVSGELGIKMDSTEKQNYATCLLLVLKPSSISLAIPVVAHRGDALCIMESDIGSQRSLGGRLVDHRTIDVGMILGWIESCMRLHDEACIPVATKNLEDVRLIDVESRQVVRYPGPKCEYIALSYVWGDVQQDDYQLHETLGALPRTLEDAMSLTKQLGKKYIWVGSLCIDQSDEQDKASQIDKMWAIYRGAWVTLIALSGTSAHAGVSRLSRPEYYPQLTYNIGGKTLTSLMSTLS
jgi:hypothetical protein